MSEEQGQAQEQPSINQLALEAAGRIIESEDPEKKQPQPEAQPEKEATAESTAEEEAQEEIRKHRIKVKREGGADEEIEVDDNELRLGYMRTQDYSRKTAEVAKEREKAQELVKAQLDPVVKEYQNNLSVFEKALWKIAAPDMENTDWNKLSTENPAEWARKMQAVTNVNSIIEGIRAENEKLTVAQQREQDKFLQKQITEATETLKTDIPGWNLDLYQKVLKTGTDYGYSPTEVNAVTDARAIKVLHDAMKYRALMSAKPQVEKLVTNVPKVVKPGTSEKPDQNRDDLNKAKAALRKSGRTDDALALARLLV